MHVLRDTLLFIPLNIAFQKRTIVVVLKKTLADLNSYCPFLYKKPISMCQIDFLV